MSGNTSPSESWSSVSSSDSDLSSTFAIHQKDLIGKGPYRIERYDTPDVEQSMAAENWTEMAENCSTQLDYSNRIFTELATLNDEIRCMTKDQLQTKLAELHLNTEGVEQVLKKRLENYHRRQKLAAANMVEEVELVPFDFLVVMNFEATCQKSNGHFDLEIIEFPAVLIDIRNKEIVGMFRELCKPKSHPVLTEFFKKLSGVEQSEVDSASEFPVVLENFERWLDSWELGSRHRFCVITEGTWDIDCFLCKQCKISQIPMPQWSWKWINIRKTYESFYNMGRISLNSMLGNLGLEFEGRPHCGLDEARNMARIVCHLMADGSELKVNEKLIHGQPMVFQPRGYVYTGAGGRLCLHRCFQPIQCDRAAVTDPNSD